MNENNVKLGQIRTEDRVDEAKISEPIPPYCVRHKRNPKMENSDAEPESSHMLPVSRDREEYREG